MLSVMREKGCKMSNFQDTSVTVFMYEDGTVCDAFHSDAYICATFAPGGRIVDYRYIVSGTFACGRRFMDEMSLDCLTTNEPINNIDDLRNALDIAMEV